MPPPKLNEEQTSEGQGKIRKRGCSSSSSSSLVRNYRLKRQILVGTRGGSSISIATGKMSSRSPLLHGEKSSKFSPAVKNEGKAKEVRPSVRKLAATLWGINEVSSPKLREILEEKMNEMDMKSRERIFKHLFNPSHHSLLSERKNRSNMGGQGKRILVSSQKLLADNDDGGLDSVHGANNFMEVSAQTHGHRPGGQRTGVKSRLEGLGSRLITSKELLKALDRIWCMEGKHSTGLSLVSALKAELDRACIEVNKLIREQKSNHKEIDCLLKQFEAEKAIWKLREQDRIHNAISSIAGELEVEKKLKRQTERLNRKLGIELADTKASLSKAVKKLESEKRAKEILEQVCNELAKGIGEDRAQAEELKRQSAKVRIEVEKEREMLQLADLLREERVQMKLSEAKLQFEEKNEAVDRLRTELEAFLQTKMGKETDDGSPNQDRIEELEKYLRNPILTGGQNGEDEKNEEVVNGQKDNEEDSADSDLHSIELNMGDISNNYEWSYIDRLAAQNDSNRNLVDEKIKGRKLISVSDKTKTRSISMEHKTSNGIDWEFYSDSKEKSDGFDRERLLELAGEAWKKSGEDETERESMIKDLRDHILFGSRIESFPRLCQSNQDLEPTLPSHLTVSQSSVSKKILGNQKSPSSRNYCIQIQMRS